MVSDVHDVVLRKERTVLHLLFLRLLVKVFPNAVIACQIVHETEFLRPAAFTLLLISIDCIFLEQGLLESQLARLVFL